MDDLKKLMDVVDGLIKIVSAQSDRMDFLNERVDTLRQRIVVLEARTDNSMVSLQEN